MRKIILILILSYTFVNAQYMQAFESFVDNKNLLYFKKSFVFHGHKIEFKSAHSFKDFKDVFYTYRIIIHF